MAASLPHLHDSGQGTPLLLLHAFPQEASMWDHQVAALSGRARCLRADAFGCGSSPPPPPGLRMDAWARAVLAALDSARVGEVAIGGLSMGGYLAFEILRAAPERITGLALLATRATPDSDDARAGRLELAERLRRDGEPAREAEVEPTVEKLLSPEARGEFHISDPVRGRIRRCSPDGLAACAEAMAHRRDSSDVLSTVRVPALVVAGSEDPVCTPQLMRGMAEAVPGAQFEVITGSRHLVNLERPAQVGDLLAEWLDRVEAVTAAR